MTSVERKQRTFNALILVFAVVIAASLCGGGVALYDRFQQTNEKRATQANLNQRFLESDKRQRQAWHDVLCLAVSETNATPLSAKFTASDRAKILSFYEKALVKVRAQPCKVGRTK